jgi:multidrug efflux pump subunit AcrA (membrane-fusion protein)
MMKFMTAAIVPIGLALAGCEQSQSQAQHAPPPKVTIAKPATRMIEGQDQYVGRFVALESVEVRARVAGHLAAVHFEHG